MILNLLFAALALAPLQKAWACASCGSGGDELLVLYPDEQQKVFVGLSRVTSQQTIYPNGDTAKSGGLDRKDSVLFGYGYAFSIRSFATVSFFLQNNVRDEHYFQERVSSAISSLKLRVDPEVEVYLVRLLCEFIDPSEFPIEAPLAEIFAQALDAAPEHRLKIFKKMGDTSLYVSGFFQDYFNRKTFDISYYMAMGQTAFSHLSRLQKNDDHISHIYSGISRDFLKLVDVFAVISEDTSLSSARNEDLLILYDRWEQTRSDRLRKKLEQQGIIPLAVPRKAQ